MRSSREKYDMIFVLAWTGSEHQMHTGRASARRAWTRVPDTGSLRSSDFLQHISTWLKKSLYRWQ